MGMRYFVVIGKEKDTDDNPLAVTLCEIGKAKGKDIRVFVTSSTGTCEFGSEAEKRLTKDVVSETFASFDKSDCRLLLFDAESIYGELKPVSGLLVWHQYYRTLQSGTEMETVRIADDILTKFFEKGSSGLFWTGLVDPPKNYDVTSLAKSGWESVNRGLVHRSQKQGGI